jgi:unsaturated chondroitin disaccharide hydrolase
MITIDQSLTPGSLSPLIRRLFEISGQKILRLQEEWDAARGTPVFTVKGRYTSRGWTEWTQGFQFGSAILQYDATGDRQFLEIGRSATVQLMATHVSHVGVHDHGFNNVSTYGNLLRLMNEGRIPHDEWEKRFYELALKVSGAVQAARWTDLGSGGGYIYSFNGPHSLFADTVRSLRSLAVAHQLGHVLMGEKDTKVSLLGRLITHADTTSRFNVYFGEGRDAYDVRGRVAHESIFNLNDRSYRCPSTQQGYSPFSTWTRGLAWILCGYAEELEFLATLPEEEFKESGGKGEISSRFLRTARAVAEYFVESTPTDGVPYWDTGAPGLAGMGEILSRPADPFNDVEPVDSSAAAIAAQGLLRLGNMLVALGEKENGNRLFRAGLTVARTIFSEPYLSTSTDHQGLVLHSVYHRPNGWDYIPPGRKIPCGEATMWGDYHARELALMIQRLAEGKPYLTFYLR